MKSIIAIFAILTYVNLVAQTKGVTQTTPSPQSGEGRGEAYAVVVGISDYQDPGIPDLKYADKDAEAFANYLRSAAGGSLDGDHLKVLINEKATMAQFAIALDWLWEVAKENDRVIIYFSGHGDVEKKSITQPGYLLCWDAPRQVYLAGGALALPMFQDAMTTLAIQNKAKVLIVVDACRSGKLSGSSIGGSQITGSNLAKQFANETKILSCQPNEYSIEGEQWGGGRGAFSYHLIDALYGLADMNMDQKVTLFEAGRYLEDHVSKEVAPHSQLPMVLGAKSDQLVSVILDLLTDLLKSKSEQLPVFAAVETKGIEEEVLASADSSTKATYNAFIRTIKEKRFFPDSQSVDLKRTDYADYYYKILEENKTIGKLHSTLRRNYAAALQDDAQQVINKYMKAEIYELSLSTQQKLNKYKIYPKQLNRAAELLGPSHYLYNHLRAREAYFEGYRFVYTNEYNNETYEKGIAYFRKSLNFQSDFPLALLGLEYAYGFLIFNKDSAEYYAIKANSLSPGWILPFVRLSQIFSISIKDFDKSLYYLKAAQNLDSSNPVILEAEASYYYEMKMYEEATRTIELIISIQPNSVCLPCSKNLLVQVYTETGQFEKAEILVKQLLSSDSTNYISRTNLGRIYTQTGRFDLANAEFKEASLKYGNFLNPNSDYQYWLAYMYANKGDIEMAYKCFETSIQLGYNDYNWMQIDPDYYLLRKQVDKWNQLMKKYFPKQQKD